MPVGFRTLNERADHLGIGLLFVDRPFIGTGVGRLLWRQSVGRAVAPDARLLGVGADSRAEGFHLRMDKVRRHEFEHDGERLVRRGGEVAAVAGRPARDGGVPPGRHPTAGDGSVRRARPAGPAGRPCAPRTYGPGCPARP